MQSLLRRLADIILVRSLLVAGCGGGTTSPSGTSSNTAFNGSPSPAISPALEVNNQQVVVQLNPMNNSGEASTTTLRTEASGTRVNITNLSGYPGTASPTASSTTTTSPLVGVQQSAASYKGTCAQLSPTPAYPLAGDHLPRRIHAGFAVNGQCRCRNLDPSEFRDCDSQVDNRCDPVSCGEIRTGGVPVSPGASPSRLMGAHE